MRSGSFSRAEKVADAVLYEGLVLYPYRKSALKNQFRWQFGIVAPRGSEQWGDASFAQSECVVECRPGASLTTRIRFLHLQHRQVEELLDANSDDWCARERLVIDGKELIAWDEAVMCEFSPPELSLDATEGENTFRFEVPGSVQLEQIRDSSGAGTARFVRTRLPIRFRLTVSHRTKGSIRLVTVRVDNDTVPANGPARGSGRDASLQRSLVGCHALLALTNGDFISALDPPHGLEEAAKRCRNEHWWPVLAGEDGARDVMLCAPIILYDYPTIAPESVGDFCDATEIDELLTLRVMTLTDAEKREAAATDDHARRIVESVDQTTPLMRANLHGAIRSYEDSKPSGPEPISWESFVNPSDVASPEEATLLVGGAELRRGDRVRLSPGGRADAMDMFLAGRTATIAGIYHDLDDRVHVAVTLDDDPGADLRNAVGRFLYFAPGELEALAENAP